MNNTAHSAKTTKKILLAGVFGPYGVDDEYGRKENVMELFHNQVTKAQGGASFRHHHRSFGLYFIAANLDADVTILDFPSKARFEKELDKAYDAVGISFIAPNAKKAQEMSRMVRKKLPNAEIILGGHGAAIEGVEDIISCDHVVKGEGIMWMRRYVGQNVSDPIVHPALPSTERRSIHGVSLPGVTSSLLVPGVGCVNACSFCSTSHFFGKEYTPYIRTGKELFNTCCAIADARGTDSFFIMDENFLKDRERALALIDEMETHNRYFTFHVFSSSEAIMAFGIDNMVRLGVSFSWIGFESKTGQGEFEKNDGITPKDLVRQLRSNGISVLGSGILCMEHHTPENIQEDIDFMIDIEADTVQFMLFTPLPVTGLYKRLQKKGLIKMDLPFEEWHGQKMLNWNHPAFPGDMAERFLKGAFKQEYEVNSSTLYRVIETATKGYEKLQSTPNRSPNLETRMETLRQRVKKYSVMLPAIKATAVNPLAKQRAVALEKKVIELVGKPSFKYAMLRQAAKLIALGWEMRLKIKGDVIQPQTIYTEFKRGDAQKGNRDVPVVTISETPTLCTGCPSSMNNAAFVAAK
ncbi:MAG: cobalamin-dependent protein [Deltaproteobacteria bacterium]|nr:cobalamin-dependent protein [Deltaproteobacteria bacterium]